MPAPGSHTLLDFVRPVRPLYKESSLKVAADVFRESGADSLPVVDGPYLVGVVNASRLRAALLDGLSPLDAVRSLVSPPERVMLPNADISEAKRFFAETDAPSVIVVDADGRYIGLLPALSLFTEREYQASPGIVGGMATPCGVFLTNGEVSGGVKPPAIVLTGALLFLAYFVGMITTLWAILLVGNLIHEPVIRYLEEGRRGWAATAMDIGPILVFFVLMRASPISGTHGAEHMVVHAIERHEPLIYETVKRMPRVHPRCGTNLAVGAMLFLLLVRFLWPPLGEAGLLLSLLFTVLLWRRVGAIVQLLITTKEPSRRQLEGAIRAGRELLENYRRSSRLAPSFPRRLLRSGLPWVLLGAFAMAIGVFILLSITGLPIAVW